MEMRRPGRGPSSRAHVSSRGRRRMDGCQRAGASFRARQPRTFVQGCPAVACNRPALGSVPDAGRAAHSRSWSRRRASAASSVKMRASGCTQQCCNAAQVLVARSGAAKHLQCPSASRRPNYPSAARTRRNLHQTTRRRAPKSGRLGGGVWRGLRAADKSGTSDPFVCVQLVSHGKAPGKALKRGPSSHSAAL